MCVNKIVILDDGRIYFGCNYKDCSREMTFAELEEVGILVSDIGAPSSLKPSVYAGLDNFSLYKKMPSI